ncbi:MAG: hypothetical protein H0X62_12385, partial [Bacteroidetes bacterium]|nr:hypothetical protein [Bacteroidota bacterium]
MKLLFQSIIFLFLFHSAFPQNIEWLSHHNWNSGGNISEMAIDKEGNVFSIGSCSGSSITGTVGKINREGELQWEHLITSVNSHGYAWPVYGRALKTDNEGNAIAAFSCGGKISFLGETIESGTTNCLIMKINQEGELLWYYLVESAGVRAIEIYKNENILIFGSISYSAKFSDTILVSSHYQSNFVLTLNNEGGYIDAKRINLSGYYNLWNLEKLSYYLIFKDSISIKDSTYYSNLNDERGYLLVDVNLNFDYQWAKQLKWDYKSGSFTILNKNSDKEGNIFLTGIYNTEITYDGDKILEFQKTNLNHFADIFLIKLDKEGNFLWSRTGASTRFLQADGITTDSYGNVFITGWYTGDITFENTSVSGFHSKKMFITKYDKKGALIWLKRADGEGESKGCAMASDDKGNVFFGGKSGGAFEFASHALT